MKTMARFNLAAVLLSCAVCLNASAATRVVSVYAESLAALQKQIFLGAEVFEAPALGALPMMITGVLPGAAQVDNTKPVAVHVINMGGSDVELLVEMAPSGEVQAGLKALAGGGADVALPEPENGIYKLGEGAMAAKIAKGRLFFTPNADDPAAVLADGIIGALPDLPAIPGGIRIALAPAAAAPMLEELKKAMAPDPDDDEDNAEAKKAQAAMIPMVDMYLSMLGQIDALYLGLDVQQAGLFIRTRLAPKAGTDMAAWVASMKPAAQADLAFIEKGSFLSCASGGSTTPERLKQQFTSFYMGLMNASPMMSAMPTNDLMKSLELSLRLDGMPSAFVCRPPADDGALRIAGRWTLNDPAGYLADAIALNKSPDMQKSMLFALAGSEVKERTGKNDLKISSWAFSSDEKAWKEMMSKAMPVGQDGEEREEALKKSLEMFNVIKKLFGNGTEYAADGKNLLLGMGAPEMVEEAAERARNTAAKASAEAERVEALLKPSGDPNSLGVLSLSGMIKLGMGFADPKVAEAVKGVAAGEGVMFAGWPFKEEVLTALLVPPSEVKAITALVQATQSNSSRRGAPARPPIPDNF